MGKLDNLFVRNSHVSKLKTLLNLGLSRLAVLRNQRQARCKLARSDIVQILNLGYHDRALIRVEQVIKEQNMLDVFVMVDGYCNLLAERIDLLKQEKVCPEELREAVSGLLYASTRCGEFPELIEIRAIFASRFGKEFAASAMELRNNCAVNPRMIQKLSTRQPNLENRLNVLKEIAAENNIVLKFEEDYSIAGEENLKKEQIIHKPKAEVSENLGGLNVGYGPQSFTEEKKNTEELSDSIKARTKYKDAAEAAQAAFESAAYAAAAARIAVELSKSENHDPDDQNNPGSGRRRTRDEVDRTKSEVQPTKQSNSSTIKDQNEGRGFGKSDFTPKYDSESEDEETQDDNGGREPVELTPNSHEDAVNGDGEVSFPKANNPGLDPTSSFVSKEETEVLNSGIDIDRSQKRFPLRSGAGAKVDSGFVNFSINLKNEPKVQNPQRSEEQRPVSVRTRFRPWRRERA